MPRVHLNTSFVKVKVRVRARVFIVSTHKWPHGDP